jgi:hypothetical protein
MVVWTDTDKINDIANGVRLAVLRTNFRKGVVCVQNATQFNGKCVIFI